MAPWICSLVIPTPSPFFHFLIWLFHQRLHLCHSGSKPRGHLQLIFSPEMQPDFVHHTVAWPNPGTLTRNMWFLSHVAMVHMSSKAPVKCKSEILHMGWRLGKPEGVAPDCIRMANPESFILERVWRMFKGDPIHKVSSVSHALSVIPSKQGDGLDVP